MKVEPLSQSNLKEASDLANAVFPFENLDDYGPGDAFRASLDPESYKDLWKKYHTKTFEYYLVRDDDGRPVGVTGFYTRTIDTEDVIWLGWFCVRPEARGQGWGKKILDWSIEEAKNRGYKKFKLFTSNDPDEAVAQILYEKIGFKVVKEEDAQGYKILYREKTL